MHSNSILKVQVRFIYVFLKYKAIQQLLLILCQLELIFIVIRKILHTIPQIMQIQITAITR
jgi:hypothetical protein